jgi:hypothetical protein
MTLAFTPGFSVVRFRLDFTQVSELYAMKSHKNQWVPIRLSAIKDSEEVLASSLPLWSEGLEPAHGPYQIRFPGRWYLQAIEREVLSWGTARKSASILSEVPIRKSQTRSS